MRLEIGILLVASLLTGCATIEVKKIAKSEEYTDGLRFYRPAPYLLVTKNEKAELSTSIIYLPDKNEEYAIRTTSGIGSVDAKATLDGGWNLTQLGATIDPKIPETITSIAGALTALVPIMALDGQKMEEQPLTVGLYRINFGENGQVQSLSPVKLELSKSFDTKKATGNEVRFLFATRAENGSNSEFVVSTSNSSLIKKVRDQLTLPENKRKLHINGIIERGNDGYNLHWSWHFVSSKWDLAEKSIELCDGTPTMVENDLTHWVDDIKRFCPWKSYVKTELIQQ